MTALATEHQLLLDKYGECTTVTPCTHMDSLHVNDFGLEMVVFFAGMVLAVVAMEVVRRVRARRAANWYKDYLKSLRNLRKDPTSAGGAHDQNNHR